MAVSVYAGVLGLIYIFLSFRVILARKSNRIALGDNHNIHIQRAIRAHGNFAEYVPLTLILIYLVETSYSQVWLVHALAGTLLLGRIIHAFGISQEPEPLILRQIGMLMTFSTLLTASLLNVYLVFS